MQNSRLVRPRSRGWLLVVLAAAVAVATGCGSAGGSATAPTGGAASSAGATGAADTSPINIGVGSLVVPGAFDGHAPAAAGIAAAEGYINDQGGWGGRKLNIVSCNSGGDPASTAACARQFTSAHVVTEFGVQFSWGSAGIPIMSAAGIMSFNLVETPQEETSPWENSLSPGNVGDYTAAAQYACASGLHSVSMITADTPQNRSQEAQFADGIYAACGVKLASVFVPQGTADPAPYAQKALSSNPQAVFVLAQPIPVDTWVSLFHGANYPIDQVMMGFGSITKDAYTSPAANGLMVETEVGWMGPADTTADAVTYGKYMAKYSPGFDPSQAVLPFSQLVTIWRAAKAIGFDKFNAQTLNQYMRSTVVGKLPIFASHGTVTNVPGYAGIKQPYVQIYRIQDSKQVSLGWYGGWWRCTSAATCAKDSPPPAK